MTEPDVRRRVYSFRADTASEDDFGRMTVGGIAVDWDSRNSYAETFVPGAFATSLADKSDRKPLVMREEHRETIGRWTSFAEEQRGLYVEGRISDTLRGRETWTLIGDGAVTGLSIGFWPKRYQFAEEGERVEFDTPLGKVTYDVAEATIFVLEADLLEVSVVGAPADDEARLEEVSREREALLTRARQERDATTDASEEVRGMATTPASSEAIEQIGQAIAALSEAVGEVRSGQTDQTGKVEAIRAEVEALQKQADEAAAQRRSIEPDDIEQRSALLEVFGGDPRKRMRALHQRSAELVAPLAGVTRDQVVEFQTRCDELVLAANLMQVHPRELDFYRGQVAPLVRALDTGTEVADWVPTELSAALIERWNLPLRVAALFPPIPMPTPTYDIPGVPVSRTRLASHSEQTADTGQTLFTARTWSVRKITLTAVKFAARVLISKESSEDAIFSMLPWLQAELRDYLAADIEDTILNGDTTATHMDADVSAGDDPRKLWDGLRDVALNALTGATADGGNNALTFADLRANRKLMGKYGVSPANLVHVMPLDAYIDLLSDSNFQTIDKYGPAATVLTGELGRADGIPVIVSEYARNDLNASGVQDGVTTDRGVAYTVYTRGFVRGMRREVMVDVDRSRYIEADQDLVLISTRQAFEQRYPNTENVVALTYNITD